MEAEATQSELAKVLEVLASPVRLALLHRLGQPAFAPDLAAELGMTRQALKKHLDALVDAGLIHASSARRGALRATSFAASPSGLFAFKEAILGLAVHVDAGVLPPAATMATGTEGPAESGAGPGLLLVHGDAPGRWFALGARSTWVLGRDPKVDLPLTYDPFASARHALLRRAPGGWTLTDLQSTNGTRVNFRPLASGETVAVRVGDLLTVGKSHLLLRDG